MKTLKQFKQHIKLAGTIFDRHKKLSTDDIIDIKCMYESGKKISDIAKLYNVSYAAISYHLNPMSKILCAKRSYIAYHKNSSDVNREIARRKKESRDKYIEELYNTYINNI